jgi:hypothetical protein
VFKTTNHSIKDIVPQQQLEKWGEKEGRKLHSSKTKQNKMI